MIKKKISALCVTILSIALTTTSVFANSQRELQEKAVHVNLIGEYNRLVEPDTAKINITIVEKGKENEKVKEALIESAAEIKQSLLSSDYKDSLGNITSDTFHINPDYDYETWTEVIGYSGYQDMSITVKNMNYLNEIVGIITDFEEIEYYYTDYTLSNYDEVYEEVLVSAIKNANDKADKIGYAFGYGDYNIEHIEENYTYSYDYKLSNVSNDYGGALSAGVPELNPSKIVVSAEVYVSYTY